MVDEEPGLGPPVLTQLIEVRHILHADPPDWLVSVQFHFAEGFLSVEANPDDDTAEVSFDPLHAPALRHWASDSVARDASDAYADVLGLDSAWRWILRNQQGYRDGFQIELGPASAPVTLQYLVAASRLYPRRTTDLPTLGR